MRVSKRILDHDAETAVLTGVAFLAAYVFWTWLTGGAQ
jgi:hypothetical protein